MHFIILYRKMNHVISMLREDIMFVQRQKSLKVVYGAIYIVKM